MVATERNEGSPSCLAANHVGLAGRIAGRLHRSYGWVCLDDLHGYAFLGLALAARAFQADRGVPFDRFAFCKGMFLAIDEMRKDGVLKRRRAKAAVSTGPISGDLRDPKGDMPQERMETRDACRSLLGKLKATDRRFLMMYYADDLTFKQIADVFHLSESAVCLRHKTLIEKLRRLAKVGERT
jgi:RNA polymerase sigma factor (sigma-70 family)